MLPTCNESFMKSVQSIDIWDLYLYCIPLHAIMSPMYFLIGFCQKIQQLLLTESKSVTWTKLKEGKPVTWTKLKEGKHVTWTKLKEGKPVTWSKLKEGKPVTWSKLKEGKPVKRGRN